MQGNFGPRREATHYSSHCDPNPKFLTFETLWYLNPMLFLSAQLEAAKDAAEKTCAALSAEVGRLRAHSDKVEAEEGRLRTALVQAQGQNESLQVELRRAQSDAARFKDEAERLRADVREHQVRGKSGLRFGNEGLSC